MRAFVFVTIMVFWSLRGEPPRAARAAQASVAGSEALHDDFEHGEAASLEVGVKGGIIKGAVAHVEQDGGHLKVEKNRGDCLDIDILTKRSIVHSFAKDGSGELNPSLSQTLEAIA